MEYIEPKAEEIFQEYSEQGIYDIIDLVAGVCYGRNRKHAATKGFVEDLIKNNHMRPLEFATVYLTIHMDDSTDSIYIKYVKNRYSETFCNFIEGFCYVTTNYRVIAENGWFDDLKYMTFPTDSHRIRKCVKITCSRAIADEFRTHTTLSCMMRSTRYCNESKNGLKLIRPDFALGIEEMAGIRNYFGSLEKLYESLIDEGNSPQYARYILPLCVATEMYMCGFHGMEHTGWNRFFDLRCDSAAHPDAQKLAYGIKEVLEGNRY